MAYSYSAQQRIAMQNKLLNMKSGTSFLLNKNASNAFEVIFKYNTISKKHQHFELFDKATGTRMIFAQSIKDFVLDIIQLLDNWSTVYVQHFNALQKLGDVV